MNGHEDLIRFEKAIHEKQVKANSETFVPDVLHKNTLMLVYKLPAFLEYLGQHYWQLYKSYAGRLTELFPTSESTANNLLIADDDETTEEENETVYHLWESFQVR